MREGNLAEKHNISCARVGWVHDSYVSCTCKLCYDAFKTQNLRILLFSSLRRQSLTAAKRTGRAIADPQGFSPHLGPSSKSAECERANSYIVIVRGRPLYAIEIRLQR